MKKISLVLSLALLMIVVFAFNVFAATTNDITNDARLEQNGSTSDLIDLSKVKDGNYNTASSCGNAGENWVNYRFYYDEGTTVSKVFVVLNSTGTLSNGTVYETVSANSYEFYVRLYDKYQNVVIGTKYSSVNNATEVKDEEGNVLYTYFEVVFDEPYSDIYMVEVPVVNNKNADVGLWEVEIYNYVCGDDEHEWVGTLCGEHCDVCGEVKDPTLACEAEEDDGDCRTAVLCKYCDSVMVASKQHVFANGETVCSNDGCVFEGKNITKDTTVTPADVSENTYGENGEFLNWWYYQAHIYDGKYNTAAHSNYWGQYKFGFELKDATKLSEIFIVSNSSGIYHPWGYGFDNLTTDYAVKVVIYDADGNAISTTEYQSLDFTNPNVVPIYAEDGEMTSVAYKLDTNYATAKKVEVYINAGIFEVEIYEHVTCDYQFVETVAPGCTTEGYDLYKCACGNEKYENTVAALGHNYDDGVVTKDATEEEDGEIVYTCVACGETKTLAIPATGHEHNYDTYVGNSVEPTCAIVGSATYQCRCGDTTEVEIPATGNHNYNVFAAYTVEPTYLKDGYADYKCETCDATINVNVGRLQMNTAKFAEVVKDLGGWTVCEKYLIDGNYNLGSAGSHTTNGWAFSLIYGEDYYFNKLAFVVNSVGRFPSDGAFNYTSKTTKNYSFVITLYDANGNSVWSKSTTCADAVEMTGIDADGNEFLYDILTIELDEAVVASKLSVKINSGWDNGAGMWEVETYGLPVNYHEVHDYTVELERYSDPTCTTAGSALFRCAKCETTSVEDIPATGHSYFYACDKVCQVCNEVSNPDATHNIVHVDAVAATCTVNG
ncbi:MAG: hypothetical protein E7596_03785, partial [Ruminococcaceae bacterium]|nr:hypothetical protein [Oscillospiraceae bacterium]